eukprot:CAMPEP_0184865818 /NCGR_PEP_ID=MMETSP0580-20130426/19193_1 /TAXON_ID=1118495 /ORGANISM="Dactyliosolen fragilissimus" /LENGTH=327 /DNA_ID=CAMNT_0027365151 /DNA_START=57 /DNA_END=1037 /DNA_ORIENTATION=-
MGVDIAFSLRFSESLEDAFRLKDELEKNGLSVYICSVPEGNDISIDIIENFSAAKLVVILGSKTYGSKGTTNFSTREELQFILDEYDEGRMKFFLIKMCEVFEDPVTRFKLPKTISYFPWKHGTPVSEDLIGKLVDRINDINNESSHGSVHLSTSKLQDVKVKNHSKQSISQGSVSHTGTRILFGNYCVKGTYEGELINGEANGSGTWTALNGDKYVGEWKEDKKCGQGTYLSPNGKKYVGEWKEDMKHGQGTYLFPNGAKYVGEWKEDKRSGQGTSTYANCDKYYGEWKENMKHGQGTYIYANGDNYVGEWKEDKKHGQGVYIYAE